jgi:hypothetical protein
MELGCRPGAFEPKDAPLVQVGRILEAVLIQHAGPGQRTECEHPGPVRRMTGQAGDFQPHHNADPVSADRRHEWLQSNPVPLGSRLAPVTLDHVALLGRPSEGQRLVA